jgi:hypothetical protein
MMAASPPAARPKVAGSENIPAPIIEPTTNAVSAGKDSFASDLFMIEYLAHIN